MNILKKLLHIPSGETVAIEAHDTWEVRWWSMGRIDCNGIDSQTLRVEVFPSKDDADRFAGELIAAAALLGDYKGSYGGGWGPFVKKNVYKGVSK